MTTERDAIERALQALPGCVVRDKIGVWKDLTAARAVLGKLRAEVLEEVLLLADRRLDEWGYGGRVAQELIELRDEIAEMKNS